MMAFGLNANDNRIQKTEIKYEPDYFLMARDIL